MPGGDDPVGARREKREQDATVQEARLSVFLEVIAMKGAARGESRNLKALLPAPESRMRPLGRNRRSRSRPPLSDAWLPSPPGISRLASAGSGKKGRRVSP